MTHKINFESLPQDEQKILNQLYGTQTSGYNLKKILYVEELTEEEKVYFDKNILASPNFFVQRLYKISGNLIPLKFNLAISKLIESTDELRMNYCSVDTRTLKVFFESRCELPKIVYRNLENNPDIDTTLKNIMEADMRQSFDLRHDSLIRFSVFHTDAEEYAVLITLPQLILDAFDAKNLFRSALGLELIPSAEKIFVTTDDFEPIKNYWAKILQDLSPTPELPFSKMPKGLNRQKAYHFTIAAAIMSDIREEAKNNKIMQMTYLQTAWAMLLQEFNQTQDTAFTILYPDKLSKGMKSIPVRIKTTDEETMQKIIDKQFKQILVSMPYASKNFSAIQKVIQPQKKTFDHFLSFGDFMEEEQLYSTAKAAADGELIMQNSFSAENTKLGIYFHYKENTTSITIMYDENRFSPNFGELLSQRYSLILQQMLLDKTLRYENFMARLAERLKVEPSPKETDVNYLRNFIYQLKLLQGDNEGTLQKIIEIAKLKTYFEGDRVSAEDMENNLIFVAEGKLVRSLETIDGWYNTLDIVKENRWINETVLLEKRKAKMSAEVLTEKAILMLIPQEKMKNFLSTNEKVAENILQQVLAEMEKYQRLWIQS